MKKRLLSILLVVAMVFSLMPISAFADGGSGKTTATQLVIPVSAKLTDHSADLQNPVACTFELTQVKKVINDVTIYNQNPMPSSAVLTLEEVGRTTVDGGWTIPLDDYNDCGTYYYTVKQTTTTAQNDYGVDNAVWDVTAEFTESEAKVISLKSTSKEAQVDDVNNFTIKKNTGTEATVKKVAAVTTLTLGGNDVSSSSAYNTAAIKSDFSFDFTRDFVIRGNVTASSAADGSFIGFVPGSNMPDKLPEGGYIAAYNTSAFINSIVFEFDAWGNGNNALGDLESFGRDGAGRHFALMGIDNKCNGYIINNQYSLVQENWNKTLPYSISLDTKETADLSDDVLTFNVNNGMYNWSCTNPTAIFGQKYAYFFMGGVLRYGPAGQYGLEGYSVGNPAPITSVTFGDFEYTQKMTVSDGVKMLFTNSYMPPHIHADNENINFQPWGEKIGENACLPSKAGNYYLTEDVTLNGTWNVPSGVTNLCLNGHVIKANGFNVITINNGVTLNLYDCQTTEHKGYTDANGLWHLGEKSSLGAGETAKSIYGGVITGGKAENGGGVYVNNGKFIMNGGTIIGNTATKSGGGYGGGVYVATGSAQFTMDGGTISSNTASSGGGVYVETGSAGFTMNKGTISNNTGHDGGGLFIKSSNPSSIMNGGTISENKGTYGGGVNINRGGKFEMKGGEISNNIADKDSKDDGQGGGICVANDKATFIMTNGTISGNSAQCGGGLCVINAGATATMSGGTITGNSSSKGGGVCVMNKSATATMNGGTITGNSSSMGGGVYFNSDGAFYLGGSVKIIRNVMGDNENNVYLPNGKYITLATGGSEGMSVGVTTQTAPTLSNPVSITVANSTATFIMTNGTISGNSAQKGGGLCVINTGATATMSGGTITRNSSSMGGGVYFGSTGALFLGGSVKIIGNGMGDNENNVYLPNGKYITLATGDNAPAKGMSVGVITEKTPTLGNPVSITGDNSTNYSSYFKSDNTAYRVVYDKGTKSIVKLMLPGTITNGTPESSKDTNHGYITIDKEKALPGETVTVTEAVPNDGYDLESLKYNDTIIGKDVSENYSFTMPAADVTVTATFKHNHAFSYSVDSSSPNVLKATCTKVCPDGYDSTPLTLTLTAPSTLTYDGSAHEAIINDPDDRWATVVGALPEIKYEYKETANGSYESTNNKSDAGYYKAEISIGSVHANVEYQIAKATITPSLTMSDYYAGIEPGTPILNGNEGGGSVTYSYKLKGADDSTYSSEAPKKPFGEYTIKADIAETKNYQGASATYDFKVLPNDRSTVSLKMPQEYEYGAATAPVLSIEPALSELPESPTVAYYYAVNTDAEWTEWTGNTSAIDAGTYVMKAVISATDSYAQKETAPISFTVKKINWNVTAPTAKENLEYTGTKQALVDAGSVASGGKMLYSINGTDYSESIPEVTDAGEYTVYYKVEEGTNYKEYVSETPITVSIAKADCTDITAPTGLEQLCYDGQPQTLVNAGSSTQGTMLYSLTGNADDFTTELPKGTDAGKYTVYYKIAGDKNHKDSDSESLTVQIAQKKLYVTPLEGQTKLYGAAEPELKYNTSENVAFTGALVRETGEDAASYKIGIGSLALVEDIDRNNYEIVFDATKVFTITKNGAAKDIPTAKTDLVYNGAAQELINAGISEDGHYEYSLSETSDYSTAIPVGTNSDSYTVWYIFKGDANHDDDLVPKSLIVQIAQKKLYVTPLEGQTKFYGAAEPELKYIASENVAFTGALVREAGEDAASYKIGIGSLALVEDIDRNNYEIVFDATKVFTITKNGAATDVPTAKTGLVYNGNAQELIYAGISEDGHYEYSLSETGDYSTAIPVGTNSDSYTVWYIFNGDANHENDLTPKSLTVQIGLRPVKVIARDNSKGLNFADPVLEYYTEGSVDTYPLTGITVTREAGEAAGTYAIIPAIDKSAYPEYDITLVNGVFIIGEHIFDRQVPDSMYLCHESTCTSQATYYYSCECGACGTAVFSYGSTKSHITSRIVIKDATTEEEGIAEYRCIYCSFSYQVPIQKLEKPATTPTPEVTPEPTDTPVPTREPEPTDTPTPTNGAEPTDTPAPTNGAEPTDTPAPTKGAEPTDTPKPTKGAEPTDTPKPTATPDPLKNHRELNVKAEAAGNNSIKLTWNEIEDASYYVVNGAECNSKNEKHPIARLAQVGGSTTTYTVSGLEKATYYKFNVVAFDAAGNRLAKSVLARAVTAGGEYTNVSKIVLKTAKKLDLKIGDKVKVNAELKLADMSKDYYINVAFGKDFILESSDKKVVKVKNGWIIAVGKGKCKVYVYAQNGAHEVIEVNVK